jgi:peptidoglycan-associated lipoprotein
VLANRSVYFDFDSYVVRADGKPVVENHSAYLGKNKARSILIQGNTDERGGAEYNLALGQKRAEAVRKAMTTLGVADGRSKPSRWARKSLRQGHNEEAWAQNRRADIVYK